MTWIEDLVASMPSSAMKIGKIESVSPLMVSWDFGEPQTPLWSDGFDLVLSAKTSGELIGRKVFILLPDLQPPFVSALVMGGPPDA